MFGRAWSGVGGFGRVQARTARLRAAAGLGSVRRAMLTRLAANILVFHRERPLQFSVDVIQAKGLGSGALAARRVAHFLVALFIGVVSGVSGLLTALAGVGALRAKGPVDDLVGGRRHWSRSEMLFIPQDGFAGFVQAGPALILKTRIKPN